VAQDAAIAREARPVRAQIKIAMYSPQGRPTIPSPDMLLGQRSDPASPAVTQAPALNQQTKETW